MGQAVGDMKSTTTVKREFERLLNEYGDASPLRPGGARDS
jgi:hypothetical protein